ncbi:hypothetical protein HID58_025151 [Brassica napus]|uniref:Uncharacterized protein n=1 Tax=Brassica napus TaxID=3708 RepID=A0ABQ8CK88_BRANA|nr:hypothetical protein HID58_025151 [Brassica napus]
MRAESGLFPDSSSIGSRVRSSKVKDVVAPLECMDSSDSSLDLTAEVEDPKAIVARKFRPSWTETGTLDRPSFGPDDRVSDFGWMKFLYTKVTSSQVSGIESLL